MRFYGYLRASTKEQNAERAKDALSTFATSLNVDITAFFVEYESGTKLDRPELVRLLEICAPGDAIVIESIDRLTRLSDSDWQTLKTFLATKRIRVIALDVPTTHTLAAAGDELTSVIMQIINDLLIDLMAVFARRDYEQRRARQKQGVQRAKALGKYKGRPIDQKRRDRVAQLLHSAKPDGTNYSWSEIQEIADCSRGLIAAVKKTLV